MHEPTTDFSASANQPTLLRRFLAETAARNQEGATGDMKLKVAKPLPESIDVLKELTQEAKSFLDALEPIQTNFRLILKKTKKFKDANAIPDHELRFLQELQASNHRKALDFGPSIHGILPYIECAVTRTTISAMTKVSGMLQRTRQ